MGRIIRRTWGDKGGIFLYAVILQELIFRMVLDLDAWFMSSLIAFSVMLHGNNP